MLQQVQSDPAYRPYWRRASTTQDAAMARQMIESRELWGRTPRYSSWPQVQAFAGELPNGQSGTEFYCDVEPDVWPAREARWSWGPDAVPRPGVRLEGGLAKIAILVTRCTQPLV